MAVRVIDVNMGIFELNDQIAEEVRNTNKANGIFMVNLMASPGSGKTTTLLRTIRELGTEYRIGVMEADIDATVDAEKMTEAGVQSIQVHTGGECAMDASMTKQALEDFLGDAWQYPSLQAHGGGKLEGDTPDLIFLENVGNLVCTAEQDTGATINVEILSIPEGDDKPLKYPLMFTICDAIIVNKIDTREYFQFDDETFIERIHKLNPDAKIFFVSAKTGEGFAEWTSWLRTMIACY